MLRTPNSTSEQVMAVNNMFHVNTVVVRNVTKENNDSCGSIELFGLLQHSYQY